MFEQAEVYNNATVDTRKYLICMPLFGPHTRRGTMVVRFFSKSRGSHCAEGGVQIDRAKVVVQHEEENIPPVVRTIDEVVDEG